MLTIFFLFLCYSFYYGWFILQNHLPCIKNKKSCGERVIGSGKILKVVFILPSWKCSFWPGGILSYSTKNPTWNNLIDIHIGYFFGADGYSSMRCFNKALSVQVSQGYEFIMETLMTSFIDFVCNTEGRTVCLNEVFGIKDTKECSLWTTSFHNNGI